MKFMNKMGKTTLASSIVAASVLSTVNVSYASGSSEQSAQTKQTQTMPLLSATQKSKNVIFMVGDGMGTF